MGQGEIGAKPAGRQAFLVKRPQERARVADAPRIHAPSVVQEGASIGPGAVVGAFSFVAAGARIGAGTRIQGHTSVWAGVTLGEDVFVLGCDRYRVPAISAGSLGGAGALLPGGTPGPDQR